MVININPAHVEPLCSAAEKYLTREKPSRTKAKEIRGLIDNLREREDEIAYLKLVHLLDMYKPTKFNLFLRFSNQGIEKAKVINEIRRHTDKLSHVEISCFDASSRKVSLRAVFNALQSFECIDKLTLSFLKSEIDDLRPLNSLSIRSLVVTCIGISAGIAPFIKSNTFTEEMEIGIARAPSVDSELVKALAANKTLKTFKRTESILLSKEICDVATSNVSLESFQITPFMTPDLAVAGVSLQLHDLLTV